MDSHLKETIFDRISMIEDYTGGCKGIYAFSPCRRMYGGAGFHTVEGNYKNMFWRKGKEDGNKDSECAV